MISPYIIGKNFFILSVENHVDILGRSGGNAEKSAGISAIFPGNVREPPHCRKKISRMEDGFRVGAPENDADSPPGTPPKSAAQPSNLPLRLPFSQFSHVPSTPAVEKKSLSNQGENGLSTISTALLLRLLYKEIDRQHTGGLHDAL